MEIKKSITIQSYRLKFIMLVSYLMHKNNSLCFSVIFPLIMLFMHFVFYVQEYVLILHIPYSLSSYPFLLLFAMQNNV